MCCDKRQIYATSLVAQNEYTDWTVVNNPIDTAPLASGDFIHDGFIQVSCATLEQNGYGEIYGIHINEHETGTLQKKDLRFWIFNGSNGTITKNSARSFTQTQARLLAGYIDIVTADYVDMQPSSPTDAMVFKDLVNGTGLGGVVVPIHPLASSQTIYVVVEARAAVTFDNTEAIKFKLLMRRK